MINLSLLGDLIPTGSASPILPTAASAPLRSADNSAFASIFSIQQSLLKADQAKPAQIDFTALVPMIEPADTTNAPTLVLDDLDQIDLPKSEPQVIEQPKEFNQPLVLTTPVSNPNAEVAPEVSPKPANPLDVIQALTSPVPTSPVPTSPVPTSPLVAKPDDHSVKPEPLATDLKQFVQQALPRANSLPVTSEQNVASTPAPTITTEQAPSEPKASATAVNTVINLTTSVNVATPVNTLTPVNVPIPASTPSPVRVTTTPEQVAKLISPEQASQWVDIARQIKQLATQQPQQSEQLTLNPKATHLLDKDKPTVLLPSVAVTADTPSTSVVSPSVNQSTPQSAPLQSAPQQVNAGLAQTGQGDFSQLFVKHAQQMLNSAASSVELKLESAKGERFELEIQVMNERIAVKLIGPTSTLTSEMQSNIDRLRASLDQSGFDLSSFEHQENEQAQQQPNDAAKGEGDEKRASQAELQTASVQSNPLLSHNVLSITV